jgi:hypothetical protein
MCLIHPGYSSCTEDKLVTRLLPDFFANELLGRNRLRVQSTTVHEKSPATIA